MPGWSKIATARAGLAFVCAVTLCVAARPAKAQYINNLCGTERGYCVVNPAPIGSQCGCIFPDRMVPGVILPPGGGYMPQQMQAISNACRTYRGICQTYPAPIGSSCGCFGDPGTVIPR